ncbi:MAG: 54S ribosomal protein, mitochondrial [Trizodia sp. TS-e1964]|nr:MAG: 54S ribosomal protein, mitochondrial [Trizodia sp. TS-e1964]
MAAKNLGGSWMKLEKSGLCRYPNCSRQAVRFMATETRMPKLYDTTELFDSSKQQAYRPPSDVLTTVYAFPRMEPLYFKFYPANQLHVPLRRDILHRAVIFEGDATRQGTASTKWRGDVHGSNAKIRPQKGTGRARLGDKKSPMLRGGGVAFGPHPRDFSTKLPQKIYDLAWRIAFSYRYRKGELVVVNHVKDLPEPSPRLLKQIFTANNWGNADGRSLLIVSELRKNLFAAIKGAGEEGRALVAKDVDVKNLLSLGRIIIERKALEDLLGEHSRSLNAKPASAA